MPRDRCDFFNQTLSRRLQMHQSCERSISKYGLGLKQLLRRKTVLKQTNMPSNKIHTIDHDKNQTYQLNAPLRQSNNF